jgi:hypothetical protein
VNDVARLRVDGGRPDTNTNPPATMTGLIGALRRRSRYVENGSTRMPTRSMRASRENGYISHIRMH